VEERRGLLPGQGCPGQIARPVASFLHPS
jgi:hypothetical protein